MTTHGIYTVEIKLDGQSKAILVFKVAMQVDVIIQYFTKLRINL